MTSDIIFKLEQDERNIFSIHDAVSKIIFEMNTQAQCTYLQNIKYELLKRDSGKCTELIEFLLRRRKTFIIENLTLSHNE